MRAYISFLILLLFALNLSAGADNETFWKEANDLFDRAQYQDAADRYQMLLERGLNNSQVYYNLGTASFKAGELGKAIWSFRRALRLDPGFRQAKANLEYARAFNTDQVASNRSGFLFDIWDYLSSLLSANWYLALLMIGWWVGAAIVVYKIVTFDSPSWLYYLLIAPAIVVIFSTASAARRINDDNLARWGVLSQESADIREGPGNEFNRIEVGHEGLEFRIIGTRENSYLIELGNGLIGWVEKEAVLEI
jgi:tetratricopeptide (TPR) repeat protein